MTSISITISDLRQSAKHVLESTEEERVKAAHKWAVENLTRRGFWATMFNSKPPSYTPKQLEDEIKKHEWIRYADQSKTLRTFLRATSILTDEQCATLKMELTIEELQTFGF